MAPVSEVDPGDDYDDYDDDFEEEAWASGSTKASASPGFRTRSREEREEREDLRA